MNTKILRILKLSIPAFSMILLSGCLKNHDGFTDFSKTTDFVILTGAGTGNFKASNVLVNTSSPDTLRKTITVDLASKDNSNGQVTVTLGVDAAAITSYNAANSASFQPFPTAAYKIVSTKLNIPAGQHYATTTLEIYQNKLDPSISYLLPISITDGGGKQLSSNQNTIYYNVIGNPLAGNYLHSYWRWNNTADTTTAPNSTVALNVPVVIGPITATSITLPEYYLEVNLGVGVALSFTNTNGVLTNPTLSIEPSAQAVIDANSFQVTTLKLVNYQIVGNAATKYAGSRFRIYAVFINNTGATRAMINEFVKQ